MTANHCWGEGGIQRVKTLPLAFPLDFDPQGKFYNVLDHYQPDTSIDVLLLRIENIHGDDKVAYIDYSNVHPPAGNKFIIGLGVSNHPEVSPSVRVALVNSLERCERLNDTNRICGNNRTSAGWSCSGDSGGPMIDIERRVVYGVASLQLQLDPNDCGTMVEFAYASVQNVHNLITKYIHSNF